MGIALSESSTSSAPSLLTVALDGPIRNIVGGVASPLLANVFLHYVFDLWVQQWRTKYATGDMIVVRYADDCATRRCERTTSGVSLNAMLRER